jgi:hypothetical protein
MHHDYPRIIGSGAAEAIPSPMCLCPVCKAARERGGKDARSRSCLRVSPEVQIDFGPAQFYQSTLLGIDLTGLTEHPGTHTHADHLALAEFDLRALAADATVCITHISHRGGMGHDEMQAFYDARDVGVRILVGFDGMALSSPPR